jgi:hypothetical protein
MATGGLWYACGINCLFYSILQVLFVDVVAPGFA